MNKRERKTFTECLDDVDLARVIDLIQGDIDNISKTIGLGEGWNERRRILDALNSRLENTVLMFMGATGINEEPNMSYMLCNAVVCCLWSSFIMSAKSSDVCREESGRKELKKRMKEMKKLFKKIIDYGFEYGKDYDNRKLNKLDFMFCGLVDMENHNE